ncbi:unnamed protein product [Scytosiphon promiscuus]
MSTSSTGRVSDDAPQPAPAAETGKGSEDTGVEGEAPAQDATNATRKPTGTVQPQSKADLAKVAETLREDAGEAMDEMRKRAARYRETPKPEGDGTDELTAQMEGLEIDAKMALYDKVFEAHPVAIGKAISKAERDETDQSGDSTLVYGEITFKTLALALHKIKTKYGLPGVGSSGPAGVLQGERGGAFYDIGSGTGKPVIAAALLHPFDKAIGIEILEGLYTTSTELLKVWEGGIRDKLDEKEGPTKVEFFLGDAFDMNVCDWTDADVVFANSTCFDASLMRKMASAATALKKGAFFITLTKRLPAAYFKVLEHDMFPMSWGSATVYISQKTTAPFGDPNATDDDSSRSSSQRGRGGGGTQ